MWTYYGVKKWSIRRNSINPSGALLIPGKLSVFHGRIARNLDLGILIWKIAYFLVLRAMLVFILAACGSSKKEGSSDTRELVHVVPYEAFEE